MRRFASKADDVEVVEAVEEDDVEVVEGEKTDKTFSLKLRSEMTSCTK